MTEGGQSLSPGRVKNFCNFFVSSRLALGSIKPPIQWVLGALSLGGLKRQGREADHSPPPNAEAKEAWIYKLTSPYAFMA
jgi:hypothetical protein